MGKPDELKVIASRVRAERVRRNWSQKDLADRITGLLFEEGSARSLKQQSIDQLEKGKLKSVPDWVRFAWRAFEIGSTDISLTPDRALLPDDDSLPVRRLPTWGGLGEGGTGDDDEQIIRFSRDLIERELNADPEKLLAVVAEGNSMKPDFEGGDQILVDTRRVGLANPGAFCLWDGDGHVIKYLEKVPDSDPPQVKLISKNRDLYEPQVRLLEDLRIIGRVVWFGRRVQ